MKDLAGCLLLLIGIPLAAVILYLLAFVLYFLFQVFLYFLPVLFIAALVLALPYFVYVVCKEMKN
ncbi:MAG: hypothetical protein J6331_09525 [Lentisphaeria bacterium]|nr:hypothetical protein [Lentisphaeria bacterium]